MITADARRGFEAMTAAGSGDARALAAGLKREVTGVGLKALAALALHAAVSCPERLPAIYDGASAGWRGELVKAQPITRSPAKATAIPTAFWNAFWTLIDRPVGLLDAAAVTHETAALCGLISGDLLQRLAAAPFRFPGVPEAFAQGFPPRFDLGALSLCPEQSLGKTFHRLIVDNGFDLEVLDRENLGLRELPPPMAYVNARILQCHDLWHIVAGYETTGLHEVAISGFQLGQFGHSYSAVFLATLLARLAFERPKGAPILVDAVLTGWVHGRESPPLMGVRWERIWDQPVEAVRAQLGLRPYVSAWPADLFEQLTRAA